VAIIGGGLSGASSAQWLYAAAPQLTLHVYEADANPANCGRLHTVNLHNIPIEAGASVVHNRNRYIAQLSAMLGLPRDKTLYAARDDAEGHHQFTMGIYSNASKEFVFQSTGNQMIDTIKFLWRYGLSPIWMSRKVNEMLDKFDQIYAFHDNGTYFSDPKELFQALGLYEYTQHTLESLLRDEMDLNQKLLDELVTGVMRINYGQNLSINALAGMVSLAGSSKDLWSVKGGNAQLCDGLLSISKAHVFRQNPVMAIKRQRGLPVQWTVTTQDGNIQIYDAVILALPLDHSLIELDPDIRQKIVQRHLHNTHATFVVGAPRPEFFGVKVDHNHDHDHEPNQDHQHDATHTLDDSRNPEYHDHNHNHGHSHEDPLKDYCPVPTLVMTKEDVEIFSSIGKVHQDPLHRGGCFGIYKIYSRQRLSDDDISEIFSKWDGVATRYDWQAYPIFTPPEKFSSFVLDRNGLYYNSAVETGASAMEMAALAARNNVLALLHYLHEPVPGEKHHEPVVEPMVEPVVESTIEPIASASRNAADL